MTFDSNFALFVFNSDDAQISGNYALHAKNALRRWLGEKTPMVLDERWQVLSGDLLGLKNMQIIITSQQISPDPDLLTPSVRKKFESGQHVGFMPYLIGVFNCPRDACIYADQRLKEDKITGYHGVILFELPTIEVIYEISFGLSLPLMPFDKSGVL